MRWILELLLKDYVDELVDKRFQEKMYEQYLYTRKQELSQRIEKVRKNLNTQAQRVPQAGKGTVLPSSNIQRSDSKPNIQVAPNTPLSDAEKMKQKLMGIK
jgi:cell division septum initiation protein DivIVA